ncbi:MAG TPA: holo-ACP synthase [Alphaproteobacteria bacterium]|nr:holo-ACP synthase [Alphaproteobacteria bacterium]
MAVGVDVCEIARIEKVWLKNKKQFEERLLTRAERAAQPKWTAEKLAKRWALKEAVAKALGTGIGERYGFHDIQIGHDAGGCPRVSVQGVDGEIEASVSDDAGIAVAFVRISA